MSDTARRQADTIANELYGKHRKGTWLRSKIADALGALEWMLEEERKRANIAESALTAARAEGYRKGLEDAAKIAEGIVERNCDCSFLTINAQIAAAIRAKAEEVES